MDMSTPATKLSTRTKDNIMKKMLLVLWPLMLVAACTQQEAEVPAAAEHAHGEGSIGFTHYSETTELFVEVRPLVANLRRRFDAHLSWLADYRAVDQGNLTVELIHADGTIDRGEAGVSDTPGIFRPLVASSKAGKVRVRLTLNARGQTMVHDLGEMEVYSTSEAAAAANPAPEAAEGRIEFTKEVQWRIPFGTAQAATRPLEVTVPVTIDVRLAPDAEAVVAAPVAGIVRTGNSVPGPGTFVRAGQTVATISAQLGGGEDVASLDLAIARSRINVQAAQREVGRMSGLYRAEAVPQRRLQEAQTTLRLAQAELSASTRRRSALGGGGPGVPLVAPISGRVLTASLTRGSAVEAGAELLRIGDPSRLWLVAHVPEAQAGGITSPGGLDLSRPGGDVTLRVGPQLRLVQGSSFVDPRTRMMDVIFAVSGMGLSPGQRLQGRLHTGYGGNALSVPAAAVSTESGQAVVYVQVEGEAFERRPVQLGVRSGDFVEIRGDVRPGERVVTVGVEAIRAAAASPASFGHGHAH